MIRIFERSDLNQLAALLRDRWQQDKSLNPLQPEQIVVQNNDMARWLTRYLAEKDGIAANLNFKFPAELFWDIMRMMKPDIPDQLSSDRGPMAWRIFQLLQTESDPRLSVLRQYIDHEVPHIQEMRCWHLACSISDVFDQYLPYRPQMVLAWEDRELVTKQHSERWQARLWRKLTGNGRDESDVHRARLQKQFSEAVKTGSFPPGKLPGRLTFFGPIDVPPSYFELITQLGQLTDIDWYYPKFVASNEQPLVQSFNQKAAEFEENLQGALAGNNGSFDRQSYPNDKQAKQAATFLDTLQGDLKFGVNNQSISADSSFQIHSCHSPRREVEVLYDQLLCLMDRDEELNPSDISIICPQIEDYAADIEAVFGAPEDGVPEIPFHISGGPASPDPMQAAFKKLLNLADSRFKMTDVIDLLECGPVMEKLELSREDLGMLSKWMIESRIHWGIDGRQKEAMGLPDTKSFTWQGGLHRMMAGYSMETEDDLLFQGIYPYDEVDQSEHGQLLGKFSQFMHRLFECHKEVQEPKIPQEWSRMLRKWLSYFFSDSLSNHRKLEKLLRLIDSVREESSRADWQGPVSFQIVCDHLENAFKSHKSGGRKTGAGVAFSSMVARHGIPAKVFGIIGMNDGDFPRSKTAPDFDLIAGNPRKGDRSPAKDDRQLFLDYLLTASHGIYLSFVGQSDRSESEYPPSAVLQELIDYIAERYGFEEKELIQKHRLQPFSKAYFDKEENDLFSYSQRNVKVAERLSLQDSNEWTFFSEPLPDPREALKSITLRDFVAFFQHPAKYLLQQRLGIYLREGEAPGEDRESFKLSALDKSHFARELGSREMKDQPLQSYYDVARSQNLLPEGWPGRQVFDEQSERSEAFSNYIKSNIQGDLIEPVEIDYRQSDIRIMGRLDSVYPAEQLLYRFGKVRPKDLIDLWIKHLFLQLVKPDGHSAKSRFISHGKGKDKKKAYAFSLAPPANPEEILNNLVEVFRDGLRHNTSLFTQTSYAYAEAVLKKNKDENAALRSAKNEWHNAHLSFPQEGDDPYNICLMDGINPLDSNKIRSVFKKHSKSFWEPIFKVLNEKKEPIT